MSRKTVLIVDDERDLVDILEFHLRREHYRVVTAGDGETALRVADREQPDLILLDLMLPGIGGLEVCRRLRAAPRTADVPIVMLTAKGEESDAVIGLSQGADDYVRKPFGVKELIARVATQMRRGRRPAEDARASVRWGSVAIDGEGVVATLRGETLPLTITEFKLLRALAAKPGRAFTRDELLDLARDPDSPSGGRTIDVHVASLRRKLDDYGGHLLTVRGVGYKCAAEPPL